MFFRRFRRVLTAVKSQDGKFWELLFTWGGTAQIPVEGTIIRFGRKVNK
jgi:hypothetical protein